jgi:hypothetical protein
MIVADDGDRLTNSEFLLNKPQRALDCEKHRTYQFVVFTSHKNKRGDDVRLSWHKVECAAACTRTLLGADDIPSSHHPTQADPADAGGRIPGLGDAFCPVHVHGDLKGYNNITRKITTHCGQERERQIKARDKATRMRTTAGVAATAGAAVRTAAGAVARRMLTPAKSAGSSTASPTSDTSSDVSGGVSGGVSSDAHAAPAVPAALPMAVPHAPVHTAMRASMRTAAARRPAAPDHTAYTDAELKCGGASNLRPPRRRQTVTAIPNPVLWQETL